LNTSLKRIIIYAFILVLGIAIGRFITILPVTFFIELGKYLTASIIIILVILALIISLLYIYSNKIKEYIKSWAQTNNSPDKVIVKSIATLINKPEEELETIEETIYKARSWLIWTTSISWAYRILLIFLAGFSGLVGTLLLFNQNVLFEEQNVRLDQQTYLQEAERRSSLVYLFSDVMDRIDAEKKTGTSKLSNELVGRIIALSHAFKPYHYLQNDSLKSAPLSPERGQLLLFLLESNLDSLNYVSIFKRGDFSYAELEGFDLSERNLSFINLSNANLERAILDRSILINVHLENANLKNISAKNSNLSFSDFQHSDFTKANLYNSQLRGSFFQSCKFDYAQFRNADIRNSIFRDASMIEADFQEVKAGKKFSFRQVCSENRNRWDMDDRLPEEWLRFFGNSDDMSDVYSKNGGFKTVSFQNANLENANFKRARLLFSKFTGANLTNANFCSANFFETKFDSAKLSQVDFQYTILSPSLLKKAIEAKANIVGAIILPDCRDLARLSFTVNGEIITDSIELKSLLPNSNVVLKIPDEYCIDELDWIEIPHVPKNCRTQKEESYFSRLSPADISDIRPVYHPDSKIKLDSVYRATKDCRKLSSKDVFNFLSKYKTNYNSKYSKLSQIDSYSFFRYILEESNCNHYFQIRKRAEGEESCCQIYLMNITEHNQSKYWFLPGISYQCAK